MISTTENKKRVKLHYDLLSTFYRNLWGLHIHHGYFKTGNESKEKAQEQLIEELAAKAGVRPGLKVLDVGCGIGGSSVYLAKNYKADVTGITISPVQAKMATSYSEAERTTAKFDVMDADELSFNHPFDLIWSIEAISHFDDRGGFFERATRLLPKGGKIALMDWFQAENITNDQEMEYIEPIRLGMLVPNLSTMNDYEASLKKLGMNIQATEDISDKVSKTWDLTFELIQKPSLWKLALKGGADFIGFLKAFRAMQKGYKSKSLVYGIIVAEKM